MHAIAEFWGRRKRRKDRTVRRLEIAYVIQLHEGGPWYAGCLGQRIGGAHYTEQDAIRHVGDWLAANWHTFQWRQKS